MRSACVKRSRADVFAHSVRGVYAYHTECADAYQTWRYSVQWDDPEGVTVKVKDLDYRSLKLVDEDESDSDV